MRSRAWACVISMVAAMASSLAQEEPASHIEWGNLPSLPQAVGSPFVGVHRDTLIVAGGSFWSAPPMEGGTKTFSDAIVILEPGATSWKSAGTLPHGAAGGASVSTPDGVLCIGGADGRQAFSEVWLLRFERGTVAIEPMPSLPQPLYLPGAALWLDTVYVAGGQAGFDPSPSTTAFHALNLTKPKEGWRTVASWPGASRILPSVVVQDNALYLFGGAELVPQPDGTFGRRYLADGYRLDPKGEWRAVADAPRPFVAAAATSIGPSHIYVFGGDDGSLYGQTLAPKDHPGFSADVWAYHTITNTWTLAGSMPEPVVTTTAVALKGAVVLAGGEDRPYSRSASVQTAKVVSAKRSVFAIDYVVLAGYFLAMVAMGWYFSRREKSTEDFFRGGQRVPWWAAGVSIFGTVLSAITFLSIPAMAYRTDWVYLIGNLCVILIAPVVVYFYLPFFRHLDVTSAYEYLEKRFSLPVRLFGSLSFILFQLGRVGIVLYLPAMTLAAATGIDVVTAIVLMGLLTILYTALGGIEAVIWTDVVQVIVLLGGAVLALVVIVLGAEGGVPDVLSTAWHDGKFRMANWTWDYTVAALWVVVVGRTLENLVPHTTDQSVIQRYMTTATEAQAARAIWLGNLMALPSSVLFFSVGTALYVFYKEHPMQLDPTLQTDATFPLFIIEQLPPGLSGLIVAALFAAAMSTLDSGLNSVSTVVTTDFYRRFKKDVDESQALRLARWVTVVMGLFGTGAAIVMHWLNSPSLWDQYIRVVGLFGGGLAGLFALGIFTRRATAPGALTGAFVAAAVLAAVQHYQPVSVLLYSAIGISTCVVVGYLASYALGHNRDLTGLTWSTRTRHRSRG